MGHYENVCNRKRFRAFFFSGRGAKVRTQAEGGHLNGTKQSYGDSAAMNESKHALNYTKRKLCGDGRHHAQMRHGPWKKKKKRKLETPKGDLNLICPCGVTWRK